MDFKDFMACKPILLLVSLLALLFTACSSTDGPASFDGETVNYKVAIVVPSTGQEHWERTAGWALENIARAQKALDRRVGIQVEWHDENDPDIENYFISVARDDSYVAMIGPISSVRACEAAGILGETGKTIILPIATSTEFQRIFAGKRHVWNLTESDMTQCEILLSQIKLSGLSEATLLTSDDDYGKSFSDWFAYQAVELGLKVRDIFIYRNHDELREAVRLISGYKHMYTTGLIFAPGKAGDVPEFDDVYGQLKGDKSFLPFPFMMCGDVVNSPEIACQLNNVAYEGVSPAADPTSGFMDAYKSRFGAEPASGEAHLFDALTLLAYALMANGGPSGLGDAIASIVDGRGDGCNSWLPDDMAMTFSALSNGLSPDLRGVTGDWTFDQRNHASVLNTIYSHWVLLDERYVTIEYLSKDGTPRTTSTFQAWETHICDFPEFDLTQDDYNYGELNQNYAVVVGASDTWVNYRHQADALAMYQLLRRHGYDDDHIVLVIEDNIAFDPRNIYPGMIRVRPDGDNVYDKVTVDYKLSDVTLTDFKDIMTGIGSERLSEVLCSGENDNVIVFWCGHGHSNRLAWGSDDIATGDDLRDIILSMRQKRKYRKMMFVMDACYSGSIGEACRGIPGVVFLTAANAFEPSKADMKDPEMGIWLSNGFTRVFQETIDADPSISLRDLYYTVARHTVGSHATVYNLEHYGNAFTNSMEEYLGGCR